MQKNIHFVINDETDSIEYYVNGKLITDCFSKDDEELVGLVKQLHEFANIPIYREIENIEW